MAGTGDEFWTWSVDFYGRPGMEEIFLDAQDRLGLDTNLLLFACWCAATGRPQPTATDWTRLIDGTAAWRNGVVAPLRAVRRQLKGERASVAAGLRARVKELEMEAEYGAQLLLLELAGVEGGGAPEACECVAEARAGIRCYADATGTSLGPGDRNLLDAIAGACCAVHAES